MRTTLVLGVLLAASGCGDSGSDEAPAPTVPVAPTRAAFTMSGRVLGPVQSDDDADMQITLTETNGVASRLNLVRLTCSNGSAQEWGAGSFVAEFGTNRLDGGTETVFVRHYVCPSSGRPARLLASLTDQTGFEVRVEAVPFHPDWPGN